MLERLCNEAITWWAVLTPEWRFLFALPFVVALSAFVGTQAWRTRDQR
mgnify:CR=1 FL=1